jgi:hypothetical protein
MKPTLVIILIHDQPPGLKVGSAIFLGGVISEIVS